MWIIETGDGKNIRESSCLWPDIPKDTQIRFVMFGNEVMEGFDAYGFQRYSLSVPGGKTIPHAGSEFIGVSGDEVTIIDLNRMTGKTSLKKIPLAELTYNPELLRDGIKG